MNNPNPFVPKGQLLDQQFRRRSRLKLAVFCVLIVSVTGLVGLLIQGCKREQPTADNTAPPPDLSSNNAPPVTATPPQPEVPSNPPSIPPANPVVVTQPVQTPPPPPPPIQPPEPPAESTYVVVAGDTLGKIAKAQGVTLKALEAANQGVDPKKLKPKQKLNIPPKSTDTNPANQGAMAGGPDAGSGTYTVVSGDTLSKIAKKNGVTLKALRAANPKYATTDHIHVGEKLTLPAKAEAAAPTASIPAPEPVPAPVSPPPSNPAPATPTPGH